jgi:hypothetical protein
MQCLFPPCGAQLTPVLAGLDSARPEAVSLVLPWHRFAGDAGWYGNACPGSMLPVDEPLDAAQQQRLRDAEGLHARGVRPRDRDVSVGILPADRSPEPCPRCGETYGDRLTLLRHLARVHGDDVRADTSPPPGGDIQSFFPTRPAESEAETGAVPDMSDNSRSGLRGMLALVSDESAHAQEVCAGLTNSLDTAIGQLEQLVSHHQSAAALAVQSVGGNGEDLPDSAKLMVLAASALGETINELRGALDAAKSNAERAYRSSLQMNEQSRQYAASI